MRQNGFYRVKHCLSDNLEIAEFKDGSWYRTGFKSKFHDWEFDLIGDLVL